MAKAYGSITLVDIGDLGQLSVAPESNQPTTVIYDPDSGDFNPDWSNSSLRLTPVIYYGSQKLTGMDNNVTITWYKKQGSGSEIKIITDDKTTISGDGTLTIKETPFSDSSITLITYIVQVKYNEPNANQELEARGQMSFGLIQNASKLKTITITGESVFAYLANNTTVMPESITLTATLKNTSLAEWQYKNSTGNYVKIPNSEPNKDKIIIAPDSIVFNGKLAVIRAITTDELYDEHTIVKVSDGAPGDQIVMAVLSNDDQMIACGPDGEPLDKNLTEAVTTITIYEGNTDVTEKWDIIPSTGGTCEGSWKGTYEYKVNKLNADVAYVQFECKPKSSEPEYAGITIYKKFSLTKIKTGADGVSPTIYSLKLNSLVINKDNSNIYTPDVLTGNFYSKIGNDEEKPYYGRYKIYLDDTINYTHENNVANFSYKIPADKDFKKITVKLLKANSSADEDVLDSQTVIITSDGQKGDNGAPGVAGVDAVTFVLGNYSDVIPCKNSGYTLEKTTVKIPFAAYQGGKRIACKCESYSELPSGYENVNNSPATSTQDGTFSFDLRANSSLGLVESGTISLTLVANELADKPSNTQIYTWTKNKQAAAGANAVLFQIYSSKGGDNIDDGENEIELTTLLTDGATTVSSGSADYQWYIFKFDDNEYVQLVGETSYKHTVRPTDVDGYASYKCVATYPSANVTTGGKKYEAYFSVYDRTDPLQVTVYSTLGDKIINGQGKGLIYARVLKNGSEIDSIKTTQCGTTLPSTTTESGYFYQLVSNTTEKKAKLMKHNGTKWEEVSDADEYNLTYNWVLRDRENKIPSLSFTYPTTGKAIYIDADVIDTKMTFDVEVNTQTGEE